MTILGRILGRILESPGYRMAILSQPKWDKPEAFGSFGRPHLFYAASAGNMDSMISHYIANRKRCDTDT